MRVELPWANKEGSTLLQARLARRFAAEGASAVVVADRDHRISLRMPG